MPSNLRSNSQSGPLKRSCVSVAAIGSSQSGMFVAGRLATLNYYAATADGRGKAMVASDGRNGRLDHPRLDDRRRQFGQGAGVRQVAFDRRDNDPRFNRDEVDADERHAHPGIDHDAFIQYTVEHIDETRASC